MRCLVVFGAVAVFLPVAAAQPKAGAKEEKDLSFGSLLGVEFIIRRGADVTPQEATFNKALQEMINRSPAAALPLIEQSLKQKPNWQPGLLGRATVLIDLKRPKEAQADAEAAIKNDPNSSAAFHLRALAKQGQGDLRGALADFDEAKYRWSRRQNLRPSRLHHYRGVARLRHGYLVGALADFDRQVVNTPQDREGYWFKATSLFLIGDEKKADAAFKEWVDRDTLGTAAADRRKNEERVAKEKESLAALRSGKGAGDPPMARIARAATVEDAVALFQQAGKTGDLEFMTQIFGPESGSAFGELLEAAMLVADAKRALREQMRREFKGKAIPELPGMDVTSLRQNLSGAPKMRVTRQTPEKDGVLLEVTELDEQDKPKATPMKMKATEKDGHWSVVPLVIADPKSLRQRAARLKWYAQELETLGGGDFDSPTEFVEQAAKLWAEAGKR